MCALESLASTDHGLQDDIGDAVLADELQREIDDLGVLWRDTVCFSRMAVIVASGTPGGGHCLSGPPAPSTATGRLAIFSFGAGSIA